MSNLIHSCSSEHQSFLLLSGLEYRRLIPHNSNGSDTQEIVGKPKILSFSLTVVREAENGRLQDSSINFPTAACTCWTF